MSKLYSFDETRYRKSYMARNIVRALIVFGEDIDKYDQAYYKSVLFSLSLPILEDLFIGLLRTKNTEALIYLIKKKTKHK